MSATSVVRLWRETGLTPSLNWKIDSIYNYLGEYYTEISPFQFLELKPKMTIKIALDQYNLQFDGNYAWDYCSIHRVGTGFDDLGAYYFITGLHWKAQNTIELELEMDVLNTFEWNGDYVVDDKTLVKRMHVDRFEDLGSIYDTITVSVSNGDTTYSYTSPYTANATIKSASASIISGVSASVSVSSISSGAITLDITSTYTQTLKIQIVYEIYAYLKIVDLKSEGIQAPLYKISDYTIYDTTNQLSWSLLYKNAYIPTSDNENTNPVNCFLYPEVDLNIYAKTSGNSITASNLSTSVWYVVFPAYNDPIPTFSYENGTTEDGTFTPSYEEVTGYGIERSTVKGIAFQAVDGEVHVQICNFSKVVQNNVTNYYGAWYDQGVFSSVEVNGDNDEIFYYSSSTLTSLTSSEAFIHNVVGYITSSIDMGTTTSVVVSGKDSIDRTDSQNIKLITYPYCPTQVTITDNYLTIGTEWWWITGSGLQLKNLNTKFSNHVETNLPHLVSNLLFSTYQRTLDGTAYKGDLIDPKLLHSDFYYKKFVYDSFDKIFRLECFDAVESIDADTTSVFDFDFIASTNIVSKFLFIFPQYKIGSRGVEDFDNILPVARNNEEVLYNSQYLNYLRNGYNYDLKTKERNAVTGAMSTGLNVASLIGSIALTASGVGSAAGVAGIVGSTIGLSNSLVNYAKTTAQAEENMQRKLEETQNQAISVLNADDFDLLEAYCDNKAKMCTYQVSVQMRDALNDLFFYCGYSVNEHLIPDVTTRYWFNYLQCDLVCTYWANISKEIQELIKQKFEEGVTFFHCHSIDDTLTWDLAQERENYEIWIVEDNGGVI